jgi:hypothetical protein
MKFVHISIFCSYSNFVQIQNLNKFDKIKLEIRNFLDFKKRKKENKIEGSAIGLGQHRRSCVGGTTIAPANEREV